MFLTVFTPAYNRSRLLPRLYESIKKQSAEDVEWLIVDDGSTDGTEQTVKGFIAENTVDIVYIKQKNAGKAAAFDHAVDIARGELFFCVDSDDILAEGAVEKIRAAKNKILSGIGGILGLKTDFDGKPLCERIPSGLETSTFFDVFSEYGCRGEYSLVFLTAVLKEIRFPRINGEKFVTESVLYDAIDEKYKLVLLNEVLTLCEYQRDGLSADPYVIMRDNPTGYKIYYARRINMAKRFSDRFGYAVRYNAFRSMSAKPEFEYKGKHGLLVSLTRPAGVIAKTRYMKKR